MRTQDPRVAEVLGRLPWQLRDRIERLAEESEALLRGANTPRNRARAAYLRREAQALVAEAARHGVPIQMAPHYAPRPLSEELIIGASAGFVLAAGVLMVAGVGLPFIALVFA